MNRAKGRTPWLLISALLVGFGFMAAISIQQSHTIEAQKGLIHQLFKDSLRLNAMRLQQQQAERHAE